MNNEPREGHHQSRAGWAGLAMRKKKQPAQDRPGGDDSNENGVLRVGTVHALTMVAPLASVTLLEKSHHAVRHRVAVRLQCVEECFDRGKVKSRCSYRPKMRSSCR